MTKPLETIFSLAHAHRRWVAAGVYGSVTALALALAVYLRFELSWPEDQNDLFWRGLPGLIALRLVFAGLAGITSTRWRFVGISDVARLTGAVLASSALYFALSWGIPLLPALPRSVLLIEALLSQYLVAGVWIGYRLSFERLQQGRYSLGGERRVLMVGAGDAGQMLVREMQRTPSGMSPVGYVDDDRVKWRTRIHGVKVWGPVDDLPKVVQKRRVDEVVIAIPSAEPPQIRRIVELCEKAGRPFSILPGIAEVLSGEAGLSKVREVRVEDLLGREPVVMESRAVREDLGGRTVLITGAAGSIGSELARQVAIHRPRVLIVVDQAETPLFYLDLELRADFPHVEVVSRVADMARPDSVDELFRCYRPDRIFHAAAYKHVPLMELNALEAVRNNVVGTWLVSEAAGRHGAGKFVLVSTDKAVRPANVMGATKRLAELAVLEAQRQWPRTAFGAVRFGNVLGSNGSVIPVFQKQLREGKPLTVTHEEVTRYFMTIPEAVQLVLKASTLSELRGHVAMLEMGEPVKILDMARNLLRLVGAPYRPGETVVFTGLRPGEKLEEELVGPEERIVDTDVDKVHLVVSDPNPEGGWLSEVELQAMRIHDAERVMAFLYERFPTLAPDDRPGVSSVAP
jgi:FlaA1/EpsC-like NDP-sugar epimerase